MTILDHHVHLFGPVAHRRLCSDIGRELPSFTLDQLLPVLDADEVQRACVLSTAYLLDRPGEDAANVRQENDWVATQVAAGGDRLVGFFSVNPLSDQALAEIDRCVCRAEFSGLKLHLANSEVDLRDAHHVKALARTVAAASAADLPIAIHVRTHRDGYGRLDAQVFCDEILPAAPDSAVQIAHMGGWGGYDDATAAALDCFVQADRDNLYFDISAVIRGQAQADVARLVEQVRALGLHRIVFGTDWPDWSPRAFLADFAEAVPLSGDEVAWVLANRTPWMRGG